MNKKIIILSITFGWCHVRGSADRVRFINFKCFEIEQNQTSSCSSPIIVYESILGFSYWSSFFIQIRPKKTLLAIFLLIHLAKYNKEIKMTVKFLMITFKQSCVIMFPRFLKIFCAFLKKISTSTISGWVGCRRKIFLTKLVLMPVMRNLQRKLHAKFRPNRTIILEVMPFFHFFIW